MFPIMESAPIILAVLGLAVLALEIWAARLNRRTSRALSKRVRVIYARCAPLIGVILVIGSLYPHYQLRSDLRIFGVPFTAVAFQFERGHWIDYAGSMTLPALVGNAAVAFLLPQLIVAGLWRIWRITGKYAASVGSPATPTKGCLPDRGQPLRPSCHNSDETPAWHLSDDDAGGCILNPWRRRPRVMKQPRDPKPKYGPSNRSRDCQTLK
jgi:hypothetical protein